MSRGSGEGALSYATQLPSTNRPIHAPRYLGPVIRGWANYYRHGASKHAFHLADHHVNAKLRRWVKRRHPTKTAIWNRSKYFDAKWNFVDDRTRLARHDEVAI